MNFQPGKESECKIQNLSFRSVSPIRTRWTRGTLRFPHRTRMSQAPT